MTGPVTALDVATYIRDNAMRLVNHNIAGYFTMTIDCSGRFASSYMDGFDIKFSLYDQELSEHISADTMENCVIECMRRRMVKAQQSPIKIPHYSAQTETSRIEKLGSLNIKVEEDDDGVPF